MSFVSNEIEDNKNYIEPVERSFASPKVVNIDQADNSSGHDYIDEYDLIPAAVTPPKKSTGDLQPDGHIRFKINEKKTNMKNCMKKFRKNENRFSASKLKNYYCFDGKLELQDTFNRIRDFVLFINTDVLLRNQNLIKKIPGYIEKIEKWLDLARVNTEILE